MLITQFFFTGYKQELNLFSYTLLLHGEQAPKAQRLHSLPGSIPVESSSAFSAICSSTNNSSGLSDGGSASTAAATATALNSSTAAQQQQQDLTGAHQAAKFTDLTALKHAGLMPLLKEIWRKQLS
jgi:hypothetical protein